MDDEQSYFSQGSDAGHGMQFSTFDRFVSPSVQPTKPPQEKIVGSHTQFRAMKSDELFAEYPAQLQKNLRNSSANNKYMAGLKGIIGLPIKSDDPSRFLESIDSSVFCPHEKQSFKELKVLFNSMQEESPQTFITSQLEQLYKKIEQIQKKAFSSISMNKTIGKAFMEHFENYLYVRENSNFSSHLSRSFQNFLNEAKEIKSPGLSLILMIYDFWMKMFKEFVRQIWNHSEKHTLNLFKKHKNETVEINTSVKSTISSSQNGLDKEKRRPWKNSQLQILEKIIDANGVFSQARLKELAEEFGRTSTSISSKVQKILKNRKKQSNQYGNQEGDGPLETKIRYILSINPKGLTKESIIELMCESYEMGMDENWKNSVGTILSSSAAFKKTKMPYKLKNPLFYYNYAFSSTLKDKIIQCMLHLPEYSGEIKDIKREYIKLFLGNDPEATEMKQIEQNISKTLSRYDVFERENAKIIYHLNTDPQFEFKQQLSMNFFNFD